MQNYAANAKARYLFGKLLTDDQFRTLVQFDNVREAIEFLIGSTHIGDMVKDRSIDTADEFEIKIRDAMFDYFEKFYHYYINEYRTFFKAVFMRYEVENIKLYLRKSVRGESVSDLQERLVISDLYSTVDYSKLSASEKLEDVIASLAETPYHQVLHRFLQ